MFIHRQKNTNHLTYWPNVLRLKPCVLARHFGTGSQGSWWHGTKARLPSHETPVANTLNASIDPAKWRIGRLLYSWGERVSASYCGDGNFESCPTAQPPECLDISHVVGRQVHSIDLRCLPKTLVLSAFFVAIGVIVNHTQSSFLGLPLSLFLFLKSTYTKSSSCRVATTFWSTAKSLFRCSASVAPGLFVQSLMFDALDAPQKAQLSTGKIDQ